MADRIDWAILDAVSDDPESLDSILRHLGNLEILVETDDVQSRLNQLVDSGCLAAEWDQPVFYGLTTSGCELWERLDRTYSADEPLDWSKSWVCRLDWTHGTGCVVGATRSACEAALAKESATGGWEVDTTSIVHRPVEGFQAKYYKWLSGGHEISFSIRSRAAN